MFRLILSLPLITCVYGLICIVGSSQTLTSKTVQFFWLFLGFLLAETALEFPQLFVPDYAEDPDAGKNQRGVRFLRQLCHRLAFGITWAYHLFVYAFAYAWPIYYTNLPIILINNAVSNFVSKDGKFGHLTGRINQISTCAFMLYVSASLDNLFGVLGSVIMLGCFFIAKKPHPDMNPDEVYWFLVAVYSSVFIHSAALYQLVRSSDVHNALTQTQGVFNVTESVQ